MPTTRDEKPAKPRQRTRKTAHQRNPKREPKVELRPDSDPVSPIVAPIEAAAIEVAPIDVAAVAIAVETETETALCGEVLPPEAREGVPQGSGLLAIAQAHDDYARKSYLAGRFLVERLIAVHSFDEAIEIQGEFAKQAYANFVAQSQKICVLYGEWAQQLFRPFGKFPAEWTRMGR
jgi:hypothetical protein